MFSRRKKLIQVWVIYSSSTWGWVNDCIFIFGWTMPLNWLKTKVFWYKIWCHFHQPYEIQIKCFIFKIRIWNRCIINTAHPWPLLQSQCHMIHQKSFSIILFCWKRNISYFYQQLLFHIFVETVIHWFFLMFKKTIYLKYIYIYISNKCCSFEH